MFELNSLSRIKVGKTPNAFRALIWLVLLLSIIILLDVYNVSFFQQQSITTLWNPIGLLFGPALYFGVSILSYKQYFNFFKHLSPFFIMGLLYIIAEMIFDLHGNVYIGQIVSYHYFYLLIPVSLWYYSFRGIKSLFYIKKEEHSQEVELLMVTSVIYVINGLLYLLIFLCWGVFEIEMGLDYRLLIYSLLFVSCLFHIRYLYNYKPGRVTNDSLENISYSNSTLKLDVAQCYQEQIVDCFENTKIYLRADISVSLLARELGIPKHHFSQIFNVHFKRNFYSFVADYRIAYAINKMEENKGILTLESLAYESGFNSKTSFNHYFKKKTGFTPTEYQFHHLKASIA